MSHWWRAYDEAVDHPKLLRLSDAMHRAWFTLQCIASANGGVLPPTEDIAIRLREKPTKIAEWITLLVKAKLIDNNNGVFSPHNWQTRQFKSDGSTERVKRFREKKGNVSPTVTRNVSETLHETGPEAETEADTEQSRADASAPVNEDLKKKADALKAGIGAMFQSRQWDCPPLDRTMLWLAQGYAAGTVLGAVEAVLKRGKPISTLDYFDGAIKDRHAADLPVAALVDTMADWHVIIEGTTEEACWQQYSRETTGRPMFICDQIHNGNTVRGAKKPTLFPPGYDEATGERIAPPENEENAA